MFYRSFVLICSVIVAGGILAVSSAEAQTTWYVDDDAPGDPGPGDPSVSDPLEDGSPEHPFDAIHEGIDAAVDGDTVLVRDGTYTGAGNRNLDFAGRLITVRSETGPETCIVDCQGHGRGFPFRSGESAAARLDGFTVTNGSNVTYGGAIYCDGASPTIMNCILVANAAERGGGMYCESQSSPVVKNCLIVENVAERGGGVFLSRSEAILTNCTMAGNRADIAGGGLKVINRTNVTITNCILSADQAPRGAEIDVLSTADPSTVTVSYSNVHGGEAAIYVADACTLIWEDSSIAADPMFREPECADYRLYHASPCIDAGTNEPPGGLPPYDLDGIPRPLDGDGDLEPWSGQFQTADMGAYEYEYGPPTTPLICRLPGAFHFVGPEGGPNPDPQTLSVWNCGIDTLNWEIAEDCPWLEVDPSNGESGGEIDEVVISVDTDGLPRGDYACTFEISDPDAANSPQAVHVNLRVLASLHVPSEYPTIQAAIDASVDGETVLVADGTYTGAGNNNLNFGGRLITVRSENGPDTCIIDCEHDGPGFAFDAGETADAVVEGFTLTNGYQGVWCFRSSPTIVNCTMAGNQYGIVGAVACCLRIFGCTIRDNEFGVVTEVADVAVADSTITENARGGIAVDGRATITHCAIARNGSGVYCDNESTIANCVITGNHSHDGGGLYCQGDTVITNCEITGNTAQYGGGGLYCRGAATISNCVISGNTAGWGSGALFYGSGPVTITSCTISGNTSGGGVVYTGDDDLVLANCTISENATTLCAGGVYYLGAGTLTVRNCTITGNVSTSHGPFLGVGGIDCQAEGTIANSAISGNIGSGVGGIYCINPTVVNCEITANEGDSGGGLMCYDGAAITNCTITGNTAVDEGGGVLLVRGNPSIANSILWANSAPQGPQVSLVGDSSHPTTLSVSHADIQGGEDAVHVDEGCTLIWGPGNIDGDPLFVDADGPDDDPNTFEDNDYRLSAGSPCIDAADNTAVPPDTLDLDGDGDMDEPIPFDLDGNPRFVDDPGMPDCGYGDPPIVDMGAYEFHGETCFGDLDGDRDVDWEDVGALLDNYGAISGAVYTQGDLDRDGDVDLADLAALLSVYGTTCRQGASAA
jgi:hypothetical protein